jgi:hypothetical protein
MSNYQPRKPKKFMVALSNDTTIPIVTSDKKRAVKRAKAWCEKLNNGTYIVDVNEVI